MLALTSAQWDITDADAAERIVAPGDVVVNCAAYTAVDAAESEPERAHAVNAVGPGNVARACAKAGARMIHISTDYVFSGVVRRRAPAVRRRRRHRSAERLRQDEAGRRAGGARGAPERPRGADVVGVHRRRVGLRRRDAQAGGGRRARQRGGRPDRVADLRRGPGRGDAARSPRRPTAPPLLHVANEGAASRFEQARAVFEGVGADPERVRPAATEDVPRPAARPPYSALSGRAATAAGLTPLRPWREALAAALE